MQMEAISFARQSKYFLGVEQDGYRTVVDHLHFHVRLERAGLNGNPERPHAVDKFFIEQVSFGWGRGLRVGWPPPSASIRV